MKSFFKFISTPVGILKLIGCEEGLVALLWQNDPPARVRLGDSEELPLHPLLQKGERQLLEYFEGKRRTFSLPLHLVGSEFQKRVWRALLEIPFGETRSYGQLAKEIGNENASRAVGAANGKNPLSIVIPCHRVIGANGKLTGFAGGLKTKAQLLALESIIKLIL